jgi:hypothetical protein
MTAADNARPQDAETLGPVDVAGLSHTGLIPTENQDHFLVARMRKLVEVTSTNLERAELDPRLPGGDAYLMVVADGVGGRAGGAAASRRRVGMSLEYTGPRLLPVYDVDEEQHFIEQMGSRVRGAPALRRANGDGVVAGHHAHPGHARPAAGVSGAWATLGLLPRRAVSSSPATRRTASTCSKPGGRPRRSGGLPMGRTLQRVGSSEVHPSSVSFLEPATCSCCAAADQARRMTT